MGTPAAAEELVTLLWRDDTTACRAAWLLAWLLRSSDIEDRLADIELPRFRHRVFGIYEWVWVPFAPLTPMARIAGRIAYLLDGGQLDDSDPLGPYPDETTVALGVAEIDRRIGIPVAALGIAPDEETTPPAQTTECAALVDKAVADLGLTVPHSVPDEMRAEYLLSSAPATRSEPSDPLLEFRAGVLDYLSGGLTHNRILVALPWPVQAALLSALLTKAKRIDVHAWETVYHNPPRPVLLRNVGTVTTALGVIALVLLAGVRTVATLTLWQPFDLDPWGAPAWSWALVASLVISLVLLGFAANYPELEDPLTTIGGYFVLYWMGHGSLVALVTLVEWLSLPWALALVVAVAGLAVATQVLATSRERARENPLRKCLQAQARD